MSSASNVGCQLPLGGWSARSMTESLCDGHASTAISLTYSACGGCGDGSGAREGRTAHLLSLGTRPGQPRNSRHQLRQPRGLRCTITSIGRRGSYGNCHEVSARRAINFANMMQGCVASLDGTSILGASIPPSRRQTGQMNGVKPRGILCAPFCNVMKMPYREFVNLS